MSYEQLKGTVNEPDLNNLTLVYRLGFQYGGGRSFQHLEAVYLKLPRKAVVLWNGNTVVAALDDVPLLRNHYLRATSYVRFIGERLGKVLAALVQHCQNPERIHLIGHSLEAHTAGFAGKIFYNETGMKIRRITGLDPAGPCFRKMQPDLRLKASDAEFVDGIHTERRGVWNKRQPRTMCKSLRRLASDETTSGRVRVELLTGEHITLDVNRKAFGGGVLDLVCQSLDVIKKEYFGLLHAQGELRVWVHLGTRLTKTFRNEPWDVQFSVKFYPPEPSTIRDDMTRYQLSLAIRRDLMEGRLACSTIIYALLGSYVLQAEAGDRPGAGAGTGALVTSHRAVSLHALTEDMEMKIDELYRKQN